jgi:hypothetical protein
MSHLQKGLIMRCCLYIIIISLLAVSFIPVLHNHLAAADIGPLLDQAKSAAAQHDYPRALAALHTALEQVRHEAPLTVAPFLPVSEPAQFYGGYTPRRDAVFRRGEQLHFYLEPKNLVYPRTAQGTYEPAFSIDLHILSDSGEVLADQERFGFFRFASKSLLQDIFVNLKVTLTGAPAGKYQIRFTVRDANSEKVATVVQPITLK